MNYGILKSGLPAERNSGLRFLETFESASEVEKNGGTINGSPTVSNGILTCAGGTDGVIYDKMLKDNQSFTVQGWFKYDSAFDFSTFSTIVSEGAYAASPNARGFWFYWHSGNNIMQLYVADDTGHFITANGISDTDQLKLWNYFAVVYDHDNSKARVYMNGVETYNDTCTGFLKDSANDFSIGLRRSSFPEYSMQGEIKDVRLFNTALSDSDIENYYNDSMFNYENEAELILPMGLKQHDPTNGYSKDLSGNGNNAVFGASTAEPTKLSDRHGYLFDGTDDYMQTSNELSLPEVTFGAMVKFNSANLNCAVSFGDTGDLYVLGTGVQASEGDIDKINFGMFSTSWKIAKTSYAPVLGKKYFIVGVVRGTTIELWVNGVLEDTDTIASDARSFLSNIGKRFDPSNPNYFDGEIDYVFQKSEALSPIQIEDLYIELKQGVNIK